MAGVTQEAPVIVDPYPTHVPAPTRTSAPRPGRPVAGYPATDARWARSLNGDAPAVVVRGVGAGSYEIGEIEARAVRGEWWAEAILRALTGR
jgi:hypothetical protein